MGGRSGGVRGGGGGGRGGKIDFVIVDNGSIKNPESLKNIPDAKLYRETMAAISRFHSALGVREREIKLADLDGAFGVHLTTLEGKSAGIFLDKQTFSQTAKEVAAQKQKLYDENWSTRTNKPVAHTVTHELAHATWNSHLKGANQRAAGKEIRALYKQFRADVNGNVIIPELKDYGRYSRSNVNEWFAETVTKAVHGKADRYTVGLKTIIKKYNL